MLGTSFSQLSRPFASRADLVAPNQWLTTAEQAAFKAGLKAAAAAEGKGRSRRPDYPTYNERAAFNDGWDTFIKKTRKLPLPSRRL